MTDLDAAKNREILNDETYQRRVGARFDLGLRTHPKSGLWHRMIEKPLPDARAFLRDRLEHAKAHLQRLGEGGSADDDVAAVAFFTHLAHAAEKRFGRPIGELLRDPPRPEKPDSGCATAREEESKRGGHRRT